MPPMFAELAEIVMPSASSPPAARAVTTSLLMYAQVASYEPQGSSGAVVPGDTIPNSAATLHELVLCHRNCLGRFQSILGDRSPHNFWEVCDEALESPFARPGLGDLSSNPLVLTPGYRKWGPRLFPCQE